MLGIENLRTKSFQTQMKLIYKTLNKKTKVNPTLNISKKI